MMGAKHYLKDNDTRMLEKDERKQIEEKKKPGNEAKEFLNLREIYPLLSVLEGNAL
jgi:hypothetical protein